MKYARLQDIAREVGISVNTVSKALNGKPGVNPQTRQRVLDAAEKLNYKPNYLAQSLRGTPSNIIGVIVDDADSPYFIEVVKGINDAALELGYYVFLFNSAMNRERELMALEMLQRIRVKGIILHPTELDEEMITHLNKAVVPIVMIDVISNNLKFDNVCNDDRLGMKEITRLVLSKPYRNIVFLNIRENSAPAIERLIGVYEALAEAGKDKSTIKVYTNTHNTAYGITRGLMLQPNRPDCLLCANDMVATQAMEAIFDVGLSIPDDVAITGYDDVPYARVLRVPLTTVSQPKALAGRQCVDLLHQRIQNTGPDHPVRIILKPEIISRKST
jgi:LacI family transcriptional regulator